MGWRGDRQVNVWEGGPRSHCNMKPDLRVGQRLREEERDHFLDGVELLFAVLWLGTYQHLQRAMASRGVGGEPRGDSSSWLGQGTLMWPRIGLKRLARGKSAHHTGGRGARQPPRARKSRPDAARCSYGRPHMCKKTSGCHFASCASPRRKGRLRAQGWSEGCWRCWYGGKRLPIRCGRHGYFRLSTLFMLNRSEYWGLRSHAWALQKPKSPDTAAHCIVYFA